MKIEWMQKKIINFLLIILPYHYFLLSRLLSKFGFLTIYRDIAILLLVILQFRKTRQIKSVKLFASIVLPLGYMLIMVFNSSAHLGNAFKMFRVYAMPLVLLWAVCTMSYTKDEVLQVAKKLLVNAAIISAYGIVQAYVLGADYLIRLGYPTTAKGNLGPSFYLSNNANSVFGRGIQRIISTFSAANMCCFYLCCIFVFAYFLKDEIPMSKIRKISLFVLIGGTVLLTFSRSCWLALGVVLISDFFMNKRNSRKMLKYVMLGTLGGIILLIITKDMKIASGIWHVIRSSFSGSDTSINMHLKTISLALEMIKNNLNGLGFGNNGPRALAYGNSNLVESSYLLMCFEVGVFGTVLFVVPYLHLFFHKWRNKNVMFLTRRMLILFVLISFINIPYIQEYECIACFYILLGLTYRYREEKIEINYT